MVGAGLAKRAVEAGLETKPWVKTSLAPGRASSPTLDQRRADAVPREARVRARRVRVHHLHRELRPLPDEVAAAIDEEKLNVVAVLSGNRNFEGRIHPQVRASYLASPLLVVAYALAGRIDLDPTTEPLGEGATAPCSSATWPSPPEIAEVIGSAISEDQFTDQYGRIWEGDELGRAADADRAGVRVGSRLHVRPRAPVLRGPRRPGRRRLRRGSRIEGARILVKVGDSITTDHISPAGAIRPTPAGAPTWSSTASRSATSTPTAPGAGTTR